MSVILKQFAEQIHITFYLLKIFCTPKKLFSKSHRIISKKHLDFLSTHCRVCSKALGKTKYSCSKYLTVLAHFGVNTGSDNSHIHPEYFCNSCYLTAKRIAKSDGQSTSRIATEWLPHNDTFCLICDVSCKGGRPKKTSSGGRPTNLHQHVRSVASKVPSFLLSQIVDQSMKTHHMYCLPFSY